MLGCKPLVSVPRIVPCYPPLAVILLCIVICISHWPFIFVSYWIFNLQNDSLEQAHLPPTAAIFGRKHKERLHNAGDAYSHRLKGINLCLRSDFPTNVQTAVLQAVSRAQTTSDPHDANRCAKSALQGTTGRWMAVGGHLELPGAHLGGSVQHALKTKAIHIIAEAVSRNSSSSNDMYDSSG